MSGLPLNTAEARARNEEKRGRILAILSLAGKDGLTIRDLAARLLDVPLDAISQSEAANAIRQPLRTLRKRGAVALVGSTNRARYVLVEHAPQEPKVEPLDLRALARVLVERHGLSGAAALDLLALLEAVAAGREP